MRINLEDLPPDMRKQAEAKIAAQTTRRMQNDKLADFDQKNDVTNAQNPMDAFQSKEKVPESKYRNEICEVNGIRFDSRKEARRYEELLLQLKAGIITDLKLQHHFTLAEAFKMPDGTPVRRMEYVADFTYTDAEGQFIIEDVKSEITRKNPVYAIKKKLMAGEGYKITEV